MSNSSKTVAALVALALLAPVARAAKLEDTVATVNGTPILLSEYQKELSTSIDYWNHTEPDALKDPANLKKLKETTLEELINREVLYQEGVKEKIKVREREIDAGVDEIKSRFAPDNAKDLPKDEADAQTEQAFDKQLQSDGLSMAQFRERLSKQIVARKLIDENVRANVAPPDDKTVKAYFDKIVAYINSGSSDTPKGMSEDEGLAFRQIAGQIKAMSSERVRVSRILIRLAPGASENEKKRALKTAEDIKKKLDGGASFAEVAKTDSEDPDTAARGGDLGYVIRGVAPPAFEKAAFSLNVGDVSDPIYTESGYNIIRVSEKRAAEAPDFDKFKDDIAKFMMNLEFQKDLEAYVKTVKAKAVVDRNLQAVE